MRFKHDPLRPHPRRKKKNETPDEAERRLGADLRLLMTDERYQKNDPDYRHFVQRQYRRVYDDPSGEPREGLRIGRPEVFVTDLEPFDRDRERRIRRGEEAERPVTPSSEKQQTGQPLAIEGGHRPDVRGGSGKALRRQIANRTPLNAESTTETDEPQSNEGDGISRSAGARVSPVAERQRRIEHITQGVEGLIAAAERRGLNMAAKYMRRYLSGAGGIVHFDWSVIRDHEPAAEAERMVRDLYTDWFVGQERDKTIGAPFLNLNDGDVLEIGETRRGGNVKWTKTFALDLFDEENLDSALVFGAGEVEGYGKLRFERHGDEITVEGIVVFILDEPYDFEGFGFKVLGISTFLSDGPVINNLNLKHLAENGPAAEFRIKARHLAEVSGTIVLRDGAPDPDLSTFMWRDLNRHHS